MKKIFLFVFLILSLTTLAENKVAFIIPATHFQEVEIFNPIGVLKNNGITHEIYGMATGEIIGDNGGFLKVSKHASEINANNYSALVIIGGSGGQSSLWSNDTLSKVVGDFTSHGKVIAGIESGAVALAKTGVLYGQNATTFYDGGFKGFIDELHNSNVLFVEANTVVSGKILTGNGPSGSIEFGEKLVELIKGNN